MDRDISYPYVKRIGMLNYAHDEIALVFGLIQANNIPSEYQFEEGL